MESPKTFRDLIAWQKSVELAKMVYQASRDMPDSERFGLTMQMRRSAVSVPSNIAEGNARQTRKEYLRFLFVARGSLAELETQLTIAKQLHLLSVPKQLSDLLAETDRVLQGLIRALQRKTKPSD